MIVEFAVMSGAGNIFSVVDNRHYRLTVEDGRRLAPLLCSPAVAGRSTEGLMLIGPPVQPDLDFHMDFFNPDGSWGAMCGNGGRCAVRFAADAGMLAVQKQADIAFTVLGTVYTARLNGDLVQLGFPPARSVCIPCTILLNGTPVTGAFVDVGSDHFVVNFAAIAPLAGSDFDSFDIGYWGPLVRYHTDFAPRGVNANFYAIEPNGTVRLRTFERGVEAETGACGTGAVSTALAVALQHNAIPPVRIIPTSGAALTIGMEQPVSPLSPLSLEGDAMFLDRRAAPVEQFHAAQSL